MARIAGVNLPTNKRVIIALTYIHGIGRTKALEIADKLALTMHAAFKTCRTLKSFRSAKHLMLITRLKAIFAAKPR